MLSSEFDSDQRAWLAEQFGALTDTMNIISPSQWAESRRYLASTASPIPGLYNYEVTPFLREIVDCLAVDSPIREVALMKGAQIGATTGIIENGVGYNIEHVKTASMMLVTADADLAKLRLESNIIPMLHSSDMMHLIASADEGNNRKAGRTEKKLEWIGGGFILPIGAQNPNKFRQTSVHVLLGDEVDGWPDVVGKDGDPVKVVRDRTNAFLTSRKIFWGSTPLLKGTSKIERLYLKGDQRKYHISCLRCSAAQVLKWRRTNNETGEVTGFIWDVDDGRLVPGSTRYLCKECGHEHYESDKTRLFKSDNAEWVPTAVSVSRDLRSYHLPALYSPVGMQSWDECALKWREAWDDSANKPRDVAVMQVVYNNIFGETFKPYGEAILMKAVSSHRRHEYRFGEIPNKFADKFCGGPIALLTCAVDVHKDNLKVAVFGWTRDRRAFLIDYHTLEGSTQDLESPETWGKLREIIEGAEYTADDGKKYRVVLTLPDSGYLTDHVYQFCAEYQSGVFAIKGMPQSQKSARIPQFNDFKTKAGNTVFGITVDLYKDRWGAALRRSWDGVSVQPYGHFNAPSDITKKQLAELTAETKVEKIESSSKRVIGWEWYRPSGAANELWDLLVYNSAAVDMLAWDFSKQRDEETTNWPAFWDACENGLYFSE